MRDLDNQAHHTRTCKGYALRMTNGGLKPWIGGSKLVTRNRAETKRLVKYVFKLVGQERKGG